MGAPQGPFNRGIHEEGCAGAGVGRYRVELGWLLCRQGQGPSPGYHQGIGLGLQARRSFASTAMVRDDGALALSSLTIAVYSDRLLL